MRTEFRGTFSNFASLLSSVRPSAAGETSPLVGRELRANLYSYGPSIIRFHKVSRRGWRASFKRQGGDTADNSSLVLLEGTITDGDGDVTRVAGSVYNEGSQPRLHIFFQDKNNIPERNVYELSIPLNGASTEQAEVTVVPLEGLEKLGCQLTAPENASAALNGGVGSGVGSTEQSQSPVTEQASIDGQIRSLELATDADVEFFNIYGDNTNNHIASLINAANVVYMRDLGIRIDLRSQNVWTSTLSPYPYGRTNESLALLSDFRDYGHTVRHLGNADLYHLFSGKSIVSGVVGRAWSGVACSNSSYSYGLTYNYLGSADWVIMAHEIGHNLGAPHDESMPAIMNAQVNFGSTSFAPASISSIHNHLSWSGFCLNPPYPTPTPNPTPTPCQPGISQCNPRPCEEGVTGGDCAPLPTVAPTRAPTPPPTQAPTPQPTVAPTQAPTLPPTAAPTPPQPPQPTVAPTQAPTLPPTAAPTPPQPPQPTVAPTQAPTLQPTAEPTVAPTVIPSPAPTRPPFIAIPRPPRFPDWPDLSLFITTLRNDSAGLNTSAGIVGLDVLGSVQVTSEALATGRCSVELHASEEESFRRFSRTLLQSRLSVDRLEFDASGLSGAVRSATGAKFFLRSALICGRVRRFSNVQSIELPATSERRALRASSWRSALLSKLRKNYLARVRYGRSLR